jgi:hypothetical protein
MATVWSAAHRVELRRAIRHLRDRGLYAAAKWYGAVHFQTSELHPNAPLLVFASHNFCSNGYFLTPSFWQRS